MADERGHCITHRTNDKRIEGIEERERIRADQVTRIEVKVDTLCEDLRTFIHEQKKTVTTLTTTISSVDAQACGNLNGIETNECLIESVKDDVEERITVISKSIKYTRLMAAVILVIVSGQNMDKAFELLKLVGQFVKLVP